MEVHGNFKKQKRECDTFYNDSGQIDESSFLKNFSHLYISIFAINYIEMNPFIVLNLNNVLFDFRDYVYELFINCFSNSGFYQNSRSINIHDCGDKCKRKEIEIIFYSDLSDNILRDNYSTFVQFFKTKTVESLISSGILFSFVDIKIEEGTLLINIRILSYNEFMLVKT